MQKYLSDNELAQRFGIARETAWRWVATNNFPKPIRLSNRCTRWRLEDVQAWEAKRGAAG